MGDDTRSAWKKVHKIILYSVLFSLFTHALQGQRYFFKNFSVKEGLSQSEVGNIIQGPSGKLYLTTAASGIDVFDGFRFHQLNEADGLVHNYISEVHLDSQDRVWFFGTHGASRMDHGAFVNHSFDNQPYGLGAIFDVIELSAERFLLGTDKGILLLDQGDYTYLEQHRDMKVFEVIRHQGEIYMATSRGLFKWNGGGMDRSDVYAEDTEVYALVSHGSELLLGVSGGYIKVLEDRFIYNELFDQKDYSTISFLRTSDARVFLGTNGAGLYILDSPMVHITEENGLSDDYIWSLFEDMDGYIWIGTSGGGLDLLSDEQFQILSTTEGLGSDIVYDIFEMPDGSIWFGMVQGGINVMKNGILEHYGVADGLSHRTVRCFHWEKDTLYIGTENGLTLYVNGQFKDVSVEYGLTDHAIFDIHRDRQGDLWFACKGERYFGENGGVVRWRSGKRMNLRTADGMNSDNVYCIRELTNGELWFGTSAGVSVWDGSRVRDLDIDRNSTCYATVLTMFEDYKHNHWIGSVEGLSFFSDTTSMCISERGLIGSTIYFLQPQGDSILWVGSASGLEKLDLYAFYEEGKLITTYYNADNGFIGTECNQNASMQDSRGDFWFGTIGGAVKYIPEKDHPDAAQVRLAVQDVKLAGQDIDWPARGFVLNDAGLPRDLALDHDDNSVQIDFLGVHLSDPDVVEYSFNLEGLNSNWSDYDADNSVLFAGLNPGDYIFQVQARNVNTGALSDIERFAFSITPAFWQTWWFKAMVVFFISASVMGFFIWRVNSVRTRAEELRLFQSRMAELEMTALRSQMNPHFLFNSLNSVNHFIIKNQKEKASDYLTKFSRLVRSVLQNSKEKLITLEEELVALRLYIELEALRFNGEFEYDEFVDERVELSVHKIPPLTLQPYVENAIWHGLLHLEDRGGKLSLAIQPQYGGVKVTIEDNGVGRAKAELLKSKSVVKKKSMGMQINADRMGLSNELYQLRFHVDIQDLYNEQGRPSGTRVVIIIQEHE